MYSVRVKKLGIHPFYFFGVRYRRPWHRLTYTYHLDAGSYRILSSAAYGMELLPRIQEIIWEIEEDDVYPYITLLLSRMTRRLWLYFPRNSKLSIEANAIFSNTRNAFLITSHNGVIPEKL